MRLKKKPPGETAALSMSVSKACLASVTDGSGPNAWRGWNALGVLVFQRGVLSLKIF